MKPPPFDYIVPESLEAALAILAEHGGEAKLLAGGQSLVPAMNFRLAQPGLLVDINRLTELDAIRQDGEGRLRLGAMTRQRRLETDPLVARFAPLVTETMPFVAHPQIRNRGTLGGSLAHADPAAELPVIMLALGGRFRVRSLAGERWCAAEDFFQGVFTTDLAAQEMLVEVELPSTSARTGWAFLEVAPRRGDYAMMGLATLVTLDDSRVIQGARLVYLNAGDRPVEAKEAARMMLGQAPAPELLEAVAVAASEKEIDPLGNVHASPAYQRHLARVLTRRGLEKALERARGGDAL